MKETESRTLTTMLQTQFTRNKIDSNEYKKRETMVTDEMLEAINEHYENTDSEIRYWRYGNDYLCVCYNALSDMDDIDDVSEEEVKRVYETIKTK